VSCLGLLDQELQRCEDATKQGTGLLGARAGIVGSTWRREGFKLKRRGQIEELLHLGIVSILTLPDPTYDNEV